MRNKLSKKLKKIDQEIDSINQVNLTNKLVEEILSKSNPSELFGKDGVFQQLKKQIVEKILASELESMTLAIQNTVSFPKRIIIVVMVVMKKR